VLHKCANPACSAKFRYVQQGRLFEVETQYFGSPFVDERGKSREARKHVEHYWLCDRCAVHITLRFDQKLGLTTVSSITGAGQTLATAIPQARQIDLIGIARVLIRSSALGLAENQEPKMRRRDPRTLLSGNVANESTVLRR
jgi:hypothetical protein